MAQQRQFFRTFEQSKHLPTEKKTNLHISFSSVTRDFSTELLIKEIKFAVMEKYGLDDEVNQKLRNFEN